MLDWSFGKKDFGDRHYILANRSGFLCRYADTGFRTKWCGFWMPPIKHIEYYAYRLKGDSEAWLSWDGCTDFSLNPWGAVHRFKVKGFDVSETVFVPESRNLLVSVLRIKNVGPKKSVSVVLEAAVNTRRKHEDWHPRAYESEFSETRNWVLVKTESSSWFTAFGVGKLDRRASVSFYPRNEYREHNPGSPQRCFLPGDYEVSFEMEAGEEVEVPFIFSCSRKSLNEAAAGFDAALGKWKAMFEEKVRASGPGKQLIRTPDQQINKAFVWNVMCMKSLLHHSDIGKGIFAGLPWFTEYWARDSFVCIPALDNIGEFGASRDILDMFMSRNVPSKVDTEGNMEHGFADTEPLFALALKHYAGSSGDSAMPKAGGKVLKEISGRVLLEGGLVMHDPEKTWMDSYKRGKSAIEVQSLWARVLSEHDRSLSESMENKIGMEYWNTANAYLNDSKNPDMEDLTANALAPLILEHLDGRKVSHVMDRLESEFTTRWGLRTRSEKDKEYGPEAYHKGSVWGLTTGAMACACLKNNRVHQALGYLKSMASEMGENAVGGSAEVLHADTGKLLGCGMQAWSSAMFITAVDEFLFGIRPDLGKGLIAVSPRLPDSWDYMERFGKRIGESSMDFMVRKDHSRLSIDINFDSLPSFRMKLLLPSGIKKMVANGKVLVGNAVEMDLKRSNSIVALS